MVCDDSKCLPPTEVELVFNLSENTKATAGTDSQNIKADTIESSSSQKDSQKGLWSIFFIAFLSGFAALLTPCVFPSDTHDS